MKAKAIIAGIIGLWVVITTFLGFGHVGILWSSLLSGVLLSVFGFELIKATPVEGWIAGIFGVWLIVTAAIPGLHTGAGMWWNNIWWVQSQRSPDS